MTALAKATPIVEAGGNLDNLKMGAVKIWEGSMVGLVRSTGYARGFTLGDAFRGHTKRTVDNSAGSAGDKRIETKRGRYVLEVALSGVAITDGSRRAPVFATDSGGLSLRAGQLVGFVLQYVSSGVALVEFDTELMIHCLSETMLIGGFTDNAGTATGYKDFATALPAGAQVIGWQVDVRTGFTGDTTAVVQIGVSGNLDRFSALTTVSVLAAAVLGAQAPAATDNTYLSADTTVRVTVTGSADFTSISAGEMDVKILYIPTLRT